MKETPKQKKARFQEADDLRAEQVKISAMLAKAKEKGFSTEGSAFVKSMDRLAEINKRLTQLNVR